jgi:hypothetical protein
VRPAGCPRFPAFPLPAIAACLALLAFAPLTGCGSSDEPSEPTATATTPPAPAGASARSCGNTTVAGTQGLRVTGIGCDVGRGVVAAWAREPGCPPPPGASRSSCTVYDGYRCLAAATERGIAVSCARPGGSAAFLASRG